MPDQFDIGSSQHGRAAFQSWVQLQPDACEPRRIVLLKETGGSFVCRLEGIGPRGATVIAKRCSRIDGELQSFVFDQVLTQLPMKSLCCYGFVLESNGENGWLFLEDGGTMTLRDWNKNVPKAVARWLARLHSCASQLENGRRLLPDRGPAHHLAILRTAHKRICESANRARLTAADQSSLTNLLSLLDLVESKWDQISLRCGTFPWTLVHGDFQTKNVMVQGSTSAPSLLVIDWEHAGWGPPAVDLAGIDCSTYRFAIRNAWPDISLKDVAEQARCGTLFRELRAVNWETQRLVWGWSERAVRRLCMYLPWLSAAAQALDQSV